MGKVCHNKRVVRATKMANLIKAIQTSTEILIAGEPKTALKEPVSTNKSMGWHADYGKRHCQDTYRPCPHPSPPVAVGGADPAPDQLGGH